MNQLQDQLNAILNDPDMMKQVQQLAQSMQPSAAQKEKAPQENDGNAQAGSPQIPTDMLKFAMELAGQSGMDKHQQALLAAMKPYLGVEKANRLKSAMEAAHLAQLASMFIGGGFPGGGNTGGGGNV